MANPFLRDIRKRANVRWFEIKGERSVRNGDREIALTTGQREVPIDNPFQVDVLEKDSFFLLAKVAR